MNTYLKEVVIMDDQKRKILIIDDDIKHLFTAQSLLEEEGYHVITHRNGFGATNLIKESAPALVLMDINMPGLSGKKTGKGHPCAGFAEKCSDSLLFIKR